MIKATGSDLTTQINSETPAANPPQLQRQFVSNSARDLFYTYVHIRMTTSLPLMVPTIFKHVSPFAAYNVARLLPVLWVYMPLLKSR